MKRLTLSLCALLASCGGKDKDKQQDPEDTPSLGMTLDAPSLSVIQGSSQATTLRLVRSDGIAGATVALTAAFVPSGVTLAFEASSTIADSVGVTVTASEQAAVADTTITITATSGELSATASLSLSVVAPAPITLHGTFMSPSGRTTDPTELHVYNSGSATSQTVTTNADGSFTVAGVLPPYDIFVDRGAMRHAFIGLTRTDPVIACYFDTFRTPTMPVDITITYSSTGTITADTYHTVTIECPHAGSSSFGTDNPIHFTSLQGYMPAAATCSIKAVEWKHKDDGLPTAYGYGESTATITPGVPASVALAITSYTGQGTSFSLTAVDSTGLPVADVGFNWVAGAFDSLGLGASNDVTLPMAAAAPAPAAGLDLRLRGIVTGTNYSIDCVKRLTNDTTQLIQCPPPPSIISPTPNATGFDASSLISVTPVANAVYRHEIGISADGSTWQITSAAPSFTVADMARFGLTLPHDGSFIRITAHVYDNVPTMDAWGAGAAVDAYMRNLESGGTRYISVDAFTSGP